MCTQSIREITSIAINSAVGGNEVLFRQALENLQKKPPKELLQGISSIIFALKKKDVNSSFLSSVEQIFDTL